MIARPVEGLDVKKLIDSCDSDEAEPSMMVDSVLRGGSSKTSTASISGIHFSPQFDVANSLGCSPRSPSPSNLLAEKATATACCQSQDTTEKVMSLYRFEPTYAPAVSAIEKVRSLDRFEPPTYAPAVSAIEKVISLYHFEPTYAPAVSAVSKIGEQQDEDGTRDGSIVSTPAEAIDSSRDSVGDCSESL
jgi:hypothetical protein